ncbi:MAG: hypothetical protein N2254_09905, partial [bacterium]|nr:hypothetical protein [bacterium]
MKRLKDFIPSFYFEEAERAEKQNPSNFEKFIEVIDILLGQLLDLIIKYKTFIDQREAPLNYLLDVLGNFKLQAVSRPKEAAMLLWVIRNSAGTKRLYEKILPILIELERIKLYNAWVLSDNNTQQIVPETQIANTSLFTPNQYPIKKIFIMRDFAIPENLIFLMRELYR